MQFTATNVADLTGHQFIRVLMENKGRSIIRTLTITQFIEVLGGSVEEEKNFVLLRDDFFPKSAKATWFADYSNYTCVWEEPAKVRLFILKTALGERHFHIPFPKLVFRLTVKNGKIHSKYCFAMKKGSNKLFCYPFGNVASSGGICMGNISEMKTVLDFSDAFFSGVTNNDYYGSDGRGKVAIKISQEALCERLEKQKTFPDKYLVEARNLTLKDLCEQDSKKLSNY